MDYLLSLLAPICDLAAKAASLGCVEPGLRPFGGPSTRAALSSWQERATTSIPNGWYVHSPRDKELPSRALRLLVAEPGTGPDRNYRLLPFAGLARWLEQPERVREALAEPIESWRGP